MVRIIGLYGKKRSGKDTVADYLVENNGFIKLSFAGKLKNICKELFKFTDEDLENKDETNKYWDVSPRKVLQFIGTDLFRDKIDECIPWIKDNFWIEILRKEIYDLHDQYGADLKIVISDCRFPNEIEFVKELINIFDKDTGKIIKIERECLLNDHDYHVSENYNDLYYTNIIYNNSSIADLYSYIDDIL